MTSPAPGTLEPYVVSFIPTSGSGNWTIPAGQQNNGANYHNLAAGMSYYLQLATDAPETLYISFTQTAGSARLISSCPAASLGVPRVSPMIPVSVDPAGPATVRITNSPATGATTVSSKCFGAIWVYPMKTFKP